MSFDDFARWMAPDAAPGAYNDWRLISGAGWSSGVAYVSVALLVLALVLSFWGLRRLAWSQRGPLLFLRLLAGLLVLFLLFEPAIELRAISRVRSRVAVMIDSSRSMDLATQSGTRIGLALKHLKNNEYKLRRLEQKATLEWHLFDERSRPVKGLPEALEPRGRNTDLIRALREVSWQGAGRELGAIIIYSDGTDTEGLTPTNAYREAKDMGIPIYTVGFGDEAAAPDLAVRRIPSQDFAFVHNTVELDVEFESRGLNISEVDASLKHEERILQTKLVKFENGRGRVSFSFKPRNIGKQVFQVSVPVQAGETVKSNNQRSIVLKVIRDRIRVLQVAGRPSWDQRFLRELLKRDPNVDLISFFILRSVTDLQKASQDELALIPFPVHELFTEELDTFDVVIYQNFSYRPYRMDRFLPNLRDYVLQGGGFMMIGGNQSFEDGWYANTALADILPVRLGGAMPWDPATFRPRLTADGRVHPITSIADAGEPLEVAFNRLPELQGMNANLGLMPDASALLTHPSLPGNPPLVAVREIGEGRSLSVGTDSLWFWRFLGVGQGGSGREFDRFWSNALRWLIRDPDLERVRLRVERSVVLLGDAASVEVEVLGSDYRPVSDVDVTVDLVRVSLDPSSPELPPKERVRTGAEGTALARFEGVPPGTYMIRAEAVAQDGHRIGEAKEPLIVEAADVELQSPFPRPDLLQALADGSEGQYADISESLPDIGVRDQRRIEVDRSRRIPIWDSYLFFLLLLVLAGLEWWQRRRVGLL